MTTTGNSGPKMMISLPMAPAASFADAEPLHPPRLDQAFVTGTIDGPAGKIPQVSSTLTRRDHWGSIKARWGVGRMDYTVDPGLYALGSPDANSPVLVTANYKMTFDCLRAALPGRQAWILVLDTKGINVWCAAGKGTFGTEELLRRLAASGLKDLVSHRKLILPQLGAPGVSAHLVKRFSGFRVYYGPIMARDIPAYLDAGFEATAAMRRKDFPMQERAVLIPIELVATFKPAAIIIPLLLIISGFAYAGGSLHYVLQDSLFSVIAFLLAILSGAVLTPLLLPYLPGRAFATKGFAIGIVIAACLLFFREMNLRSLHDMLLGGAWLFMLPAMSAFLAMNFTGASTYTSLSGVRKEMRWALPAEIGTSLAGFAVLVISRFC